MNGADWKIGDLAVCIHGWKCTCGHPQCDAISPRKEEILRVAGMSQFEGILYLGFEGKPNNIFWDQRGFRKIAPDTEAADDKLWVEQLRHFRRKVPA